MTLSAYSGVDHAKDIKVLPRLSYLTLVDCVVSSGGLLVEMIEF
jgi:hypothetical protein